MITRLAKCMTRKAISQSATWWSGLVRAPSLSNNLTMRDTRRMQEGSMWWWEESMAAMFKKPLSVYSSLTAVFSSRRSSINEPSRSAMILVNSLETSRSPEDQVSDDRMSAHTLLRDVSEAPSDRSTPSTCCTLLPDHNNKKHVCGLHEWWETSLYITFQTYKYTSPNSFSW